MRRFYTVRQSYLRKHLRINTCLSKWGLKISTGRRIIKVVNYGWGDLALNPYDMAKIGRLLLNNGKWNGVQLISADYIKKSTSIQIPFSDHKGYGYGFWVDNDHSFNAVGRGGQRIHVDRLYNAIVVATGGGYDWDEKEGISDLIGSSVHLDALSKNQPASDSLKVAIANAAKMSGILPV